MIDTAAYFGSVDVHTCVWSIHAFLSGNSIPLYSHNLRGIAPIFYQSFPKIIAHLFFGTHTWFLGLREIHNTDFLYLFE
ncbi:hypothetical protein B188_24410 [Candidatus Brocadiaceae bacterium B188]|nr:hypothetical protein B188_24410 [Candidatus Brocadiaceae bacterium B188]